MLLFSTLYKFKGIFQFIYFVSVSTADVFSGYRLNVSLIHGLNRLTWRASCMPFAFIGWDRSSFAVTSEIISSTESGSQDLGFNVRVSARSSRGIFFVDRRALSLT